MKDQPRGILFHWVANMAFAGIALGAGILFGLRIHEGRTSLMFTIIALVGFLMIPLTRKWDRDGIAKRQAEQDATIDQPTDGHDRNSSS